MRGAIAAGHPKTVEAGMEMFRLGGNVFDAVAASVLASCVVEPTLTSLGGGGFLLAHTQAGEDILFDFFTQTPRQKRSISEIDFFPVEVNFGTAIQEFHIGLGSMAVPGTIGGIWHVQHKLGRLPFKTVIEPAVDYAARGVEVREFQAYCMGLLRPILMSNAASRSIYAPHGNLLQAKETFRMPEFAETLIAIAEQGIQLFYAGDIAQQLAADSQTQGGYLTIEDLKSYRVIERQPLVTQYRGETFLTNPPPSSGGTLIAFALALLAEANLQDVDFGSTEHLRLLTQAMRLTNQARKDGYDSCLYEPDVAERFLSRPHLRQYQQDMNALLHGVNKWGSTTHLSAIDAEGNAASVTTSNGEGAGYVIPGTGIMVNNMLGEADLHPAGFHEWQENQRISSMMSPTILLNHGVPEIVLGSGGSNRIRTAIVQVISNIVDFKMSVEEAVNSPRIHWEDGVCNVEPGFANLEIDRTRFPFDDRLILWEQQNMFFGGVHAVVRTSDGNFDGAGDRRRGGSVQVCGWEK